MRVVWVAFTQLSTSLRQKNTLSVKKKRTKSDDDDDIHALFMCYV